ncbi:hypothetical protein KU43P_00140 [Pseudomonas sp. KU43P]|nr:hypothetical protein KU43P_00140 [Pseudomonas sp. KU43P]
MPEVIAKCLNWLFISLYDIFLKIVHKFFRGIRKPAFTAGFFMGFDGLIAGKQAPTGAPTVPKGVVNLWEPAYRR